MSVKRYEVNGTSSVFEDANGSLVDYEDYAALEARCAALAAEVQAVKSAALEEIEVINRGGQAYCVKDGMSVNPIYARGWNDYRAKSLSVETPATDAFLAEVRASELESLAGVAETMLVKFSNQRCSSDMHEVVGWKMVHQQASNRAAQVRKGVQS
ncbi:MULTISPECIES: hypothetical protein [Enterobacter]|uniref:hypothetical protein n=1 Tax=Enterobacter TaxID=547 RepID=UPI002102C43D|nr:MULTISPECIES: hypothetical protein [Enterobacter]MDU1920974.1 hypothetical protein [Enterobacter sp.]